jgi:two-component system, OmpR family, KDP operon response regulator KdpE
VTRNLGQPSILAVDDEPQVLEALSTILSARGYRLRTVPNGAMALDAIVAERPDVLLLDLAMPGINGLEVCRRVRAFSRLPILVLSAIGNEQQKVKALDAGADDYITKPFGVEELLARIRAALRRAESQRDDEAVIRVGGIELDQISRRVLVDGVEVHLTPTQYELLRVFVSNPDRLLTQRTLLVLTMGPAYEDAVDNLRTFINQLRGKVERDPARPQRIVTEPGLGYRLRWEPIERGEAPGHGGGVFP